MKKLLLSASLFANIVFLLLACQKENVTVANENTSASIYEADAIARFNTATIINCSGAAPSMPYSLVYEMVQNYRNNQQAAIAEVLSITDANACWFELDAIKNFICHLEQQVQRSGCSSLGTLGLRFYYSAHTPDPASYGMPSNYAKLHNLIIVPTYQSVNGLNVDFDPRTLGQGVCIPKPLGLMTDSIGAGGPLPTDIFALNHGQLGPP
jgi:hypothetical protein